MKNMQTMGLALALYLVLLTGSTLQAKAADAIQHSNSQEDDAWRSFFRDYKAAWKDINQSRDQIRESLATIKEARTAAIASWEAIRTQRQQIKDASAAIDESLASFVAKYEAAWKAINAARDQVKRGQAAVDEAWRRVEQSRAQIRDGWAACDRAWDDVQRALDKDPLARGGARRGPYNDAKRKINGQITELNSQWEQVNRIASALNAKRSELNSTWQTLDKQGAGWNQTLDRMLADLTAKRSELNAAWESLNDQAKNLNATLAEWKQREEAFHAVLRSLNKDGEAWNKAYKNFQAQVQRSRAELDALADKAAPWLMIELSR